MYLILVYDAAPKRGTRLLKYLRTKLNWVQNSVFEGEITETSFEELKTSINSILNKEKDSVIYYTFDSKNYFERGILGVEKNTTDAFI